MFQSYAAYATFPLLHGWIFGGFAGESRRLHSHRPGTSQNTVLTRIRTIRFRPQPWLTWLTWLFTCFASVCIGHKDEFCIYLVMLLHLTLLFGTWTRKRPVASQHGWDGQHDNICILQPWIGASPCRDFEQRQLSSMGLRPRWTRHSERQDGRDPDPHLSPVYMVIYFCYFYQIFF